MNKPNRPFNPTPAVTAIINTLLDIYERRDGNPKQAVRVNLQALAKSWPSYYSQTDPTPRTMANQQLTQLAQLGYLILTWQPAQINHLLETVTLCSDQTAPLYALLQRQPVAQQRQALRSLLLAERNHLSGWRKKAVEHCLNQLKAYKSPAPFSLTNTTWNEDLLTTLNALPDEEKETEVPYRVFSVRLFNDSKHFEHKLKNKIATLARRHNPLWRDLTPVEVLQEMGLVANPGHIYLSGPWQLVDEAGQVLDLDPFMPSVGIPAALAAGVQRVSVNAARIVCVENLAAFYQLIRHQSDNLAALCLWGNPSPATRHLLRVLAEGLPPHYLLYVWADIDYGGLNILAHLRQQVSPRFTPYLMDTATLNTYAHWGHPLSTNDKRNLSRLSHHSALKDMQPLIKHILTTEIKLEQEAISF